MPPRLFLLVCASLVGFAARGSTPPTTPALSPEAALARLREGNARYRAGAAERPHQDAARRNATATHGQQPFAVLLACADSRVPPEVVFDQGIGDLFVIRVAGNIAGGNETATVEYGSAHLGAALCVVVGHTGCGAVQAAVSGGPLQGDLAKLVGAVTPAVERTRKQQPGAPGPALVAAVVETNVWLSIETLFLRSEVLRTLAGAGKLRVIGAVYDLATGDVKWLGPHPEQQRLLAPPAGSPP